MKRVLQGTAPITVQRGPTKDIISLAASYELNAFAVATGTNTIAATFTPALVLADGLQIKVRAAGANTGAATFNGIALTKLGGTALAAGDIAAAGHELILRYRLSVPRWELLNPASSAGSTPTGTGFTHITAGVQDAAAVTIDGQSAAVAGDVAIIAPGTHAATSKTTPVDADELPLVDSAATYVLKKLTWANLKATLKAYFDTIYQAIGGVAGGSDAIDTAANLTITLSRGAGAETIALKTKAGIDAAVGDAITLSFRDVALTTGGYVARTVTAANSLAITSGATLGVGTSATITVTIASPGVVSYAANKLRPDDGVIFTTSGALPTGITAGTTYYVVADAGYNTDAFRISTTIGGAAINTSGTQSGVHTCTPVPKPFRIWVVAADDGGTIRLGVIRCDTGTSIVPLKDDLIVSSVAMSAASDSSGVYYSGVAWTSKPIRVLGYLDYTLAVAGTWNAAPTFVQLYGRGMKLPGDRIQLCRTTQEGFATTTTTFADAPLTEVPVNTLGTEFMTVTLTTTAAANRVRVQAVAYGTPANVGWLSHGLWKDSDTRALRGGRVYTATAAGMFELVIASEQLAGTAASQTFRFRCGSTAAGTFTFNGISSSVQAGGKTASFMEAEEIMV